MLRLSGSPAPIHEASIEEQFKSIAAQFVTSFHQTKQPHVKRVLYGWARSWTATETGQADLSSIGQEFVRAQWRKYNLNHAADINKRRRDRHARQRERQQFGVSEQTP